MKQIRSFFLVFLCMLLAVPVFAANGYQAELIAADKTLYVGDRVAVSIQVSRSGDTTFAAADLTLCYDASRLSLVSVSPTSVRTDSSVAGKLRLVDYGEDKALGGSVYTVVFEVLKAGNAEVSLSSAAFSTSSAAAAADLTPAALGSALTLSVSAGEKPLRGDANGSKTLEIADVLRLVKYALGLCSADEVKCDPDVNENGSFGLDDIVCTLRLVIEASRTK